MTELVQRVSSQTSVWPFASQPLIIWALHYEVPFQPVRLTGSVVLPLGVAFCVFVRLAGSPFSRIKRATRFSLQATPCLFRSRQILGLPGSCGSDRVRP